MNTHETDQILLVFDENLIKFIARLSSRSLSYSRARRTSEKYRQYIIKLESENQNKKSSRMVGEWSGDSWGTGRGCLGDGWGWMRDGGGIDFQ